MQQYLWGKLLTTKIIIAAKHCARSILPKSLRSFSSHPFYDMGSCDSPHFTDGTLKHGAIQVLSKVTQPEG